MTRGREPHPEHVDPGHDREEAEHSLRRLNVSRHAGAEAASRTTSATLSTTSPIDATTSSPLDSQDGPSRNVPVEMMPVAITNAK